MSEHAGELSERRGSLLRRLATYVGGGLATAQEVEVGYNSHLTIKGFDVSPSITSTGELDDWLDANPRHQHSDVLFLDTPPGADPELT